MIFAVPSKLILSAVSDDLRGQLVADGDHGNAGARACPVRPKSDQLVPHPRAGTPGDDQSTGPLVPRHHRLMAQPGEFMQVLAVPGRDVLREVAEGEYPFVLDIQIPVGVI